MASFNHYIISSRTLILFFLNFPAVWAKISWLFSNFTLNIALGNNSVTFPLNSKVSCLANYFPFFFSLIFTELAWPYKFSYFAKFITDGPNLSIPVLVIFISECRFKKSLTDNPDENLAVPDVGSTWLGPAI